jgi:hypothetical protein
MPFTNLWAIDKTKAALDASAGLSPADALDQALEADTNGPGAEPSTATKEGVASSGTTPPGLNGPSDSFVPAVAGAAGHADNPVRDQEKKKSRYEGMQPLFFTDGDCYAVIQSVPDVGQTGTVQSFEDFILTSVQSPMRDRMHPYRNFDEPIFYFSGKDVEIFSFSGYVMSGRTTEAGGGGVPLDNFTQYYRVRLRGTVSVENKEQTFISYNGWIITGYIFDFQPSESSDSPALATFSFQMAVTGVRILNASFRGTTSGNSSVV